MNVNKKFDRFKQWAGERMGGEIKTSVSDEFRSLEAEMGLRHEGMEKMHKSMNLYVKAMAKRAEAEDKEKNLPIGFLGRMMVNHGQEFENHSEFGQCLSTCGQTHENLARIQESYVSNASSTWLESLDRSLAQMKEYQTARKKLETRRLAYDTSLTKLERQKKEDFRVEEELRNARAKFEETTDDVHRRMQDIKDTESDSVNDLYAFVEAELSYHQRCHEALLQLKQDWPSFNGRPPSQKSAPKPRSRANTATQSLYTQRLTAAEDLSPPPSPEPEARPSIRSNRSVSTRVLTDSRVGSPSSAGHSRPSLARSTTFEAGTTRNETSSGFPPQRLARVPSESAAFINQRSQLRTIQAPLRERAVFDDPDEETTNDSSPDRSYGDSSPTTSTGSSLGGLKCKGPPPPPPSRAKKPPPPPPPAKRVLMT